jgi:hypothetical protein
VSGADTGPLLVAPVPAGGAAVGCSPLTAVVDVGSGVVGEGVGVATIATRVFVLVAVWSSVAS